MNLDDFSITCFCVIDEMLPEETQGKRPRQRGPMPKLADSEVITMELMGAYLGLSQDQEVFDYFRRHYAQFFPEMAQVDRTTFVRQAAHKLAVKERLWCVIRDSPLLYVPTLAFADNGLSFNCVRVNQAHNLVVAQDMRGLFGCLQDQRDT